MCGIGSVMLDLRRRLNGMFIWVVFYVGLGADPFWWWWGRAEAEERAWAETDRFYNARLTELDQASSSSSSFLSSSTKARGKQRANVEEAVEPRIGELPERFKSGVRLALKVLAEGDEKTPLDQQLDDLQFEVRGSGVMCRVFLGFMF